MMSLTPVRVLLVEDNPLDAALVRAHLSNVGSDLASTVEQVDRLDDAIGRLTEGGIDLVLLDLNLPDSRGVSTVMRVIESSPNVSVVVLTGVDDEETELRAMAANADDYLVKMVLDKRQLQRALQRARRSKTGGAPNELTQPVLTGAGGSPSVLIAGCDTEALWSLNLMLRSDGYQTGVTSNLTSFIEQGGTPDVVVLSLGIDFEEAGQLISAAQRLACPTVAVLPGACRESQPLIQRMGLQTVLATPIHSGDLSGAIESAIESLKPNALVDQAQPA